MAGTTAAPYGLKPMRLLDGSPWNGAVKQYLITSGTDVFIGDPVVLTGTAGAAGVTVNGIDCEGMPTVAPAAAGALLLGVCVGKLPSDQADTLHYATGNQILLICDNPQVVYRVQEDGVVNSLVVADVGENCDMITYAAGSTVTGNSIIAIDSSTHSATNGQFRVLRKAQADTGTANPLSTGGAAGNYCDWEVFINEHIFTTGAAGI